MPAAAIEVCCTCASEAKAAKAAKAEERSAKVTKGYCSANLDVAGLP